MGCDRLVPYMLMCYLDKYKYKFGHFQYAGQNPKLILTLTLNKYSLQFGKTYSAIWSNIFRFAPFSSLVNHVLPQHLGWDRLLSTNILSYITFLCSTSKVKLFFCPCLFSDFFSVVHGGLKDSIFRRPRLKFWKAFSWKSPEVGQNVGQRAQKSSNKKETPNFTNELL